MAENFHLISGIERGKMKKINESAAVIVNVRVKKIVISKLIDYNTNYPICMLPE